MITVIAWGFIFAAHAEDDYPPDSFRASLFGTLLDRQKVERVGPPTQYFVDVERYRFHATDMSNPSFYPIPQDEVTRDTYMRCIDASNPEELARNPKRGMTGPQAFLPVLAKYVQTGETVWGETIIAMLKDFHRTMRQVVADRKWFWQFEWPSTTIPLYRKYLIQGGLLEEDSIAQEELQRKHGDAWFREMWLYYCRNLHVWDSEPNEWRGGCHRSTPEAMSKGLAAMWYPDIPEAEHWKSYSELVFGDFWRHKDVPQNDTGYMMGPIIMMICVGDQVLGDDRYYTDPGMKRLWERLMVEVTPDGAINPYGPNGGYNSTAAYRLFMLERIAAKTGDGRYRFAAHKLMNYLRYQSQNPDTRAVALAWLFADDSIKQVCPESGSLWNERSEAVRISHTDKELTERWLGNIDPTPNKGHVCCGWVMSDKVWPDKLVLRSSWNPGDFFALVELHPTSFPANPGGIMGLNRYGASFTQIVTSKGSSHENRVLLEDMEGTATRRYHPDRNRIDEHWQSGVMPDIRSEVPYFKDTPQATFARVRVENMDALPVIYEREFIFVKNRFLVTRELVTFEESFKARVAPLWNTQNVGPQIGSHWANTFLSAPVGGNGTFNMKAPPVDLLVWFAPRDDCRLQVVDRFILDPRTADCPAQVRYTWEGLAESGQQFAFTQVYYPHAPYRARASTVNPGAKAVYSGGDIQATACASGITVIKDTVETTVLQFAFEPERIEWVVFNPKGDSISVGQIKTDASYAYLDCMKNEVTSLSVASGSFLFLKGKELFRQQTRGVFQQ